MSITRLFDLYIATLRLAPRGGVFALGRTRSEAIARVLLKAGLI